MSTIDGDDADNTITGTTGSDTISGFGGSDSLDGGNGNDTIFGGDGDDTITGGRGDDTIVGGRGDDVMTAGNNSPSDTFLIRDGDGNDIITDFDTSEPDVIAFNMAEIATFQDVQDRMSMDGSDLVITYDNGSTTRLQNVNQSDFGSSNFRIQSGPICFHAGTSLATPTGAVLVEHLQAGDLVLTRDQGPQRILQMVNQTVHFGSETDRARPILIKAGALSPAIPRHDLIVSPQHRLLVMDPASDRDVLVAAVHLLGRSGVRRMRGRKSANYYNLLLEQHHIVQANGCAAETLMLSSHSAPLIAPDLLTENLRVSHLIPARAILRDDPGVGQVRATVSPSCS